MTTTAPHTIADGEYHPAANAAMRWVKDCMRNPLEWALAKESMASTALSGNRLADICVGTMERLEKGEPVSDRYLLGLAWTLRAMRQANQKIGTILSHEQKAQIIQLVGKATMQWDPKPTGVFDSEAALAVANEIVEVIENGTTK